MSSIWSISRKMTLAVALWMREMASDRALNKTRAMSRRPCSIASEHRTPPAAVTFVVAALAGVLHVAVGVLPVGGFAGLLGLCRMPPDLLGGITQRAVGYLQRLDFADDGQGAAEELTKEVAEVVGYRLHGDVDQLPLQFRFQVLEGGVTISLVEMISSGSAASSAPSVKSGADLGPDELAREHGRRPDHGVLLRDNHVRRGVQGVGEVVERAVQVGDEPVVVFPVRGQRAGERRPRGAGQVGDDP